jgi:hypothetical protein
MRRNGKQAVDENDSSVIYASIESLSEQISGAELRDMLSSSSCMVRYGPKQERLIKIEECGEGR